MRFFLFFFVFFWLSCFFVDAYSISGGTSEIYFTPGETVEFKVAFSNPEDVDSEFYTTGDFSKYAVLDPVKAKVGKEFVPVTVTVKIPDDFKGFGGLLSVYCKQSINSDASFAAKTEVGKRYKLFKSVDGKQPFIYSYQQATSYRKTQYFLFDVINIGTKDIDSMEFILKVFDDSGREILSEKMDKTNLPAKEETFFELDIPFEQFVEGKPYYSEVLINYDEQEYRYTTESFVPQYIDRSRGRQTQKAKQTSSADMMESESASKEETKTAFKLGDTGAVSDQGLSKLQIQIIALVVIFFTMGILFWGLIKKR